MPYKPDGSPPPRGRCPKDREGLLIIMKNKDLWRNIIQVVVSILTAALTALGTTSCMKLVSWQLTIDSWPAHALGEGWKEPTVKQEGEGCTGCSLPFLKITKENFVVWGIVCIFATSQTKFLHHEQDYHENCCSFTIFMLFAILSYRNKCQKT